MKNVLLTYVLIYFTQSLSAQGGGTVYYDFDSSNDLNAGTYQSLQTDDYLLYTPLESYRSTFDQLSDFNFSFVRYSRRGYDHRMRKVFVDGIDLSDGFNASVYWNVLSALNDATRDTRKDFGLAAVGGVGAVDNYSATAALRMPYARVSLMATDRRFAGGGRFSISSGWLKHGWAYSLGGSRRAGRDGHIDGLFTDDWTLSASVAKKVGGAHWLSASFMMAPSERSVRGAATSEAYELYGDNLYNPYWGYQNGKMRSSRVRNEQRPLAIATWNWEPSDRFSLTTSLSYMFGRSSYSSLDWYDAPNPIPDYYRSMPNFFNDPEVNGLLTERWNERDPKVTQLDWGELYYVNRNTTGTAAYIVGSDVSEISNLQAVSSFRYNINDLLDLSGGVRGRRDSDLRYRRLDDLLGAEYILDIDQYLIDDEYYGDKLLNNMGDPDREVREGDSFGYNYELSRLAYGAWAILEIGRRTGNGRLSGYAGLDVNQVSTWRRGNYEKELFSGGASLGESPHADFTEYTLKGGVRYIINPANIFNLDLSYGDMAPSAGELFMSQRYQNAFAGTPRTINVLAAEAGYRLSLSPFEVTLAGYVTTTTGQTEVKHFYDDVSREYSNAVMRDVGKLYAGGELGIAVDITSRLSLRAAAAMASNVYTNDPVTDIYSDKNSEAVAIGHTAFIKGYRLGGTPQSVASGELRYSGQNMWTASVAVNYAADNYVSINPMRRMKRVFNHVTAPELTEELMYQECFPSATTVNLFISKTFDLGEGYLSLTGSISNLANRKDIIYSGYEQMRLAKSRVGVDQSFSPFASKYYYGYGRTYYLTVNYRF